MFRIMLVVKQGKSVLDSCYQFLTDIDQYGNTVIYEAKTIQELDYKVEQMLNDKYAKKDFIIVSMKDYHIDADIVINN